MGGVPEGQSILGHKIWTYICPEGMDHAGLHPS